MQTDARSLRKHFKITGLFFTGLFLSLFAAGCELPGGLGVSSTPVEIPALPPEHANLSIDASRKAGPINPFILGNNIQWVDDADELWDSGIRDFNPRVFNYIKQLRIPSLRFPGGTLSDAYHWRDAVGPVEERKEGIHIFNGARQKSSFGTDEFLRLCASMNSEPLITVNTWSGTPEEAADWVRYTNQTQGKRVTYWEIGNEPYLEPEDKTPVNPAYPEIFARKFVEFAKAMKAADPSIQVGLPLRNPKSGRYPAGPFPEWNQKVLPAAGPSADFGAVHNAYFPSIFQADEARFPDSFLAQMAAPEEVRTDLEETRKMVLSLTGKNLPLAVTEYNSFFALQNLPASRHTASLGEAVYAASLLINFLKEDSILMAHFWSLTGNWNFGAISQKGRPRPSFYALKLFSDYVGKDRVQSEITGSPVFDSPAAGFMPAKQGVPALVSLVTATNQKVFVILVNRSLQQDMDVQIQMRNFSTGVKLRGSRLSGPSVQSDNEDSETVSLTPFEQNEAQGSFRVRVPKYSITAFHIEGA